jgi:hypothetical protein
VQNVIHVFLSQDVIAHSGEVTTPAESALLSNLAPWNTGRNHYTSLAWIVGQHLFAESPKPSVGILHGGIPDNYPRESSSPKSWSFPEIKQGNIHPHSLASYDFDIDWIGDIAVPDVWSLVYLKLLGIVVDAAFREPTQPSSQKCIDQEHPSCNLSPKKVLVLMGCILVVSGFKLLFKIIDKIHLDARFNVNVAVGGFFLAAYLF